MNTRGKAALAAMCVLLALSMLMAGCTRPKPTEAAPVQPTATVALTPAATQASGTPVGTSAPQLTSVSVGTIVPTPTSMLPAPAEPTPAPTAVAPEPTPTPEPASGSAYTIREGDTLFGLAIRFGTTVAELAALNGISEDAILSVGQTLQVPGGAATPPNVHVVQAGENLFRIALRYGTTWQALAQLNGITDPTMIYVGQKLTLPSDSADSGGTPPSSGRTHVIRAGDTLYGLALTYGTTAQAIADANGLTLYSMLYVGQTLTIP